MLHARAHGSSLELVFRNAGTSRITIPINSAGYDDRLSVRLTRSGAPPLELTFREPSDKPNTRTMTLAPRGSYTETIDVVSGALRGNVDPPPPGDYEVTAFWDDRRGSSRLEDAADTKLSIPAAVEQPCTSKPAASGLELLARQATPEGTVEIGLHNVSSGSICVAARLEGAGVQSDWLTIELADALGKPLRTVGFVAARRATAKVTVELPPGATTWGRWDLVAWTRGSSPLPHGVVSAIARYDSARETTVFHGALTARFTVNLR